MQSTSWSHTPPNMLILSCDLIIRCSPWTSSASLSLKTKAYVLLLNVCMLQKLVKAFSWRRKLSGESSVMTEGLVTT